MAIKMQYQIRAHFQLKLEYKQKIAEGNTNEKWSECEWEMVQMVF